MKILVVNGGSSSFKFALFQTMLQTFTFTTQPIWKKSIEFSSSSMDRKPAIQEVLSEVSADIDLVGHRVVHGGNFFVKPTKVTSEVKKTIQQLSLIAPLHNPINLEGIEIAEEFFPKAQQIAVFDTAFHATMPEVAWTYPGPWEWREEGIRRYGFHGISHQYCSEAIQEWAKWSPQKLITCHLGNGSSCAALLNGKVIDTTMGFTPMEGLMMGTRSGSIDPGILIYLQREKGMDVRAIDQCLNKQSGLLGIGGSFDMRKILEKIKEGNSRAKLAFDLYIYRLKQSIGALMVSLGGLNALCFTGGIGENSAEVRQSTLEGLQFLGMGIDVEKNFQSNQDSEISSSDSKSKVFVIHLREDWLIAKECLALD